MSMFGPGVEPAGWDLEHKYTPDSVQVNMDENHTPKAVGFRAFYNSAPRLWNALLQASKQSEFSSAFPKKLNIHVLKSVIAPPSTSCFSLSVFSVVYHLAKRLPQYVPQAWLFYQCLGALQIDNHHHHNATKLDHKLGL